MTWQTQKAQRSTLAIEHTTCLQTGRNMLNREPALVVKHSAISMDAYGNTDQFFLLNGK
jgi:hypothetical protein